MKKILITEGGKVGYVWGVNVRNTSLEFNKPDGTIDPVVEEIEVVMPDQEWDQLRNKKDKEALKDVNKIKKNIEDKSKKKLGR